MGVRQGLGTLIKQNDNKAQLKTKNQRHLIKEKKKKIQRHSPIKKKKNRGIVIRKFISIREVMSG